jgi:hypothetical protein
MGRSASRVGIRIGMVGSLIGRLASPVETMADSSGDSPGFEIDDGCIVIPEFAEDFLRRVAERLRGAEHPRHIGEGAAPGAAHELGAIRQSRIDGNPNCPRMLMLEQELAVVDAIGSHGGNAGPKTDLFPVVRAHREQVISNESGEGAIVVGSRSRRFEADVRQLRDVEKFL